MAAINSPNADLEQSIFKANLKEMKLRQRVILVALLPIAIGLLWLLFSLYQVTTWQARADALEQREVTMQEEERSAQKRIDEALEKMTVAEARSVTALAKEKDAKTRAIDAQRRLLKARAEIGTLVPLLTDLASVRAKATKLNSSEAVETELSEIRSNLGRTLGRIEQEIDKSLSTNEQRPRVFLFVVDDTQKETAKGLLAALEAGGFEATIAKNPGRRADTHEIRYFNEARDKAEATRLQGILSGQPVGIECRLSVVADPDQANGSRKFQIWLGKAAPASH
jgi:hypothetical protein